MKHDRTEDHRAGRLARSTLAVLLLVGLATGCTTTDADDEMCIRDRWEVPEALPPLYLPRPALDAIGSEPLRALGAVAAAMLVVASGAVAARAVRQGASAAARTAGACALVGWTHLVVLAAARLLLDRTVSVSGRLLLPWWTCTVIALAVGLWSRLDEVGADQRSDRPTAERWAPAAAAGIVAVALVLGLPGLGSAMRDPKASWYDLEEALPSSLAAAAQRLPPDLVIHSNREDLLYLEGVAPTSSLPTELDPRSLRPNPTFAAELSDVAGEVRAGEAAIVLYTADPTWGAQVDEIVEASDLDITYRDDEGVILR